MSWAELVDTLLRAVPPEAAAGLRASALAARGEHGRVMFSLIYDRKLDGRRMGRGRPGRGGLAEEEAMREAVCECLRRAARDPSALERCIGDARELAWWRGLADARGLLPPGAVFDASGRLDRAATVAALALEYED